MQVMADARGLQRPLSYLEMNCKSNGIVQPAEAEHHLPLGLLALIATELLQHRPHERTILLDGGSVNGVCILKPQPARAGAVPRPNLWAGRNLPVVAKPGLSITLQPKPLLVLWDAWQGRGC